MPERQTSRADTQLEIGLGNDAIRIGPHLQVSLQRTLRIPDDGRQYPLPPGLGRFPVKRVRDYRYRVPAAWRERSGFFIPMHSREAMWLSFSVPEWRACALKVGAGEINAVSGAPWSPDLSDDPERPDYIVCPNQPWLDGFNAGDGYVRQFVAVPLGLGYTAEEQLTGEAKVGGIQLRAFEPKDGVFPDEPPKFARRAMTEELLACCAESSAPEMGLGAGGRMEQKIYPDPYGLETWDPDRVGDVFIHLAEPRTYYEITGELAPPSPVDVETYTRLGYPWFALDDEEARYVRFADRLAGMKSVAAIDAEKGAAPGAASQPVEVAPSQILPAD